MIIGFTGTRKGLTPAQLDALDFVMANLYRKEYRKLIHGGCHGADVDAHHVAVRLRMVTEVYPGDSEQFRRFTADGPLSCDFLHDDAKSDYLYRNRLIVAHSDFMIATPGTMTEQARGGTWYTIRHARKMHKPLTLIHPDGTMREEVE